MVTRSSKRAESAGVAMVALEAMSWGTWSLFLRPTGLPAAATGPLMMAMIGLFSLAIVPLEGVAPRWDRISVALLLANAEFDSINLVGFFGAMDHTSVAIAVLTHYLAPVLVIIATKAATPSPKVFGETSAGSASCVVVPHRSQRFAWQRCSTTTGSTRGRSMRCW